MPLPELNEDGELPPGVHRGTLPEVLTRLGSGTPQRQEVTARLVRIHEQATATGKLKRFVVFGSFVTAKPGLNDVDVVLVMSDDFDMDVYDEETRSLFYHRQADDRWGASIFWICSGSLIRETVDQFLAYWQTKKDKTQRGIVEVVP